MAHSVEYSLKKAKNMLRKGELTEAKKVYESILVAFPGNVRAKTGLASCDLMRNSRKASNQVEDVIEECKKVTKKNLRVLKVRKFKNLTEQRSIFAGALIQDSNNKKSEIKTIYGTNKLKKDQLNFFVNILKYIKSNAIALFDNDSLVSQSGGQTSRVDALQNCFYKLKQKHDYKKFKNLSLFSDAFFPFTDSLEFIKKEKIKINIFAPMGSQNDEKIESYVKKNKLNFFRLSDRHFKH